MQVGNLLLTLKIGFQEIPFNKVQHPALPYKSAKPLNRSNRPHKRATIIHLLFCAIFA